MSVGQGVVVSGTGRLPVATVQRVARKVLEGERRSADLSFTFLGRAAMRRLNRDYKGHDTPTDVISFALPQPDGGLAGDIYLCRWSAAVEAHRRNIPVREELLRLVIHGTLHVLGHDHPEATGREQSTMWKLQERYLEAFS